MPVQYAMVVLAQLFAMMRLQLFYLRIKIFPLKKNLCRNITSDSYHMQWEQIQHWHPSCIHDYIRAELERPG